MTESTKHTEEDGTISWRNQDGLHNENGPALIWAQGDKFWCINDKKHRTDGPAAEFVGGHKEWFLNDKEYSFEDYVDKIGLTQEQIVMYKLEYM